MAEALVGGAFLSASLQVLFDRVATREFRSFFTKRKFDDELVNKLKTILLALQAVQDDAEDKQITNKHVKAWLDELQHVICQAEDLLDEIATKALRDKLEADHDQSQSQSSTTQVGFNRFFHPVKQSLIRINHSTKAYVYEESIESRIKGMMSKLEWFVEQKNSLNLRENVGRKQFQRQETTSLVDESDVYGRRNDIEKIFELLLSGNATDNEIGVIPIVGMGGIGKTTLAQFVYNNARVNESFHVKSWVCVSEAFDICMITKKILDDVTASNNNINSLDQLQIKLKESLAGKKFLIVLDDVWNDDYIDWDLLRRPFRTGALESRIIVTTRIDKVATVLGTAPSHHLKQLSFDDSWSLFAKHAFGSGDCVAHSDLKKIGEQIVEKCKGLPLAIKSLGGLLRSKLEPEEWDNILKSEIWDLQESKILPALKLSYHYLPSHLKRCFAYCSIFPKDYKFKKEKLVQLWIALDLVQQPKNNMLWEDAGNYYFCELLARSFFKRSSHSYFLMHDLIHDLAQDISGEFCLMLEDGKPLNHICEKLRHFSYVKGTYDALEKFKAVIEVKYLRTFISFFGGWGPFLSHKVLHALLPSLRFLRVLSLSKYQISELPQSIGNLIHLRYLDLSATNIKRLPDSITNLCNLQTLDLSYCVDLIELPLNMGNLINLRHLDIRETRLTKIPMQMSRLKDLQHLTYFVVGRNNGSRISGLKEIHHLRGQLRISGLQNVTSGLDASEANLKHKKHLEGLVLEWNGDTSDTQKERDILDKLQPHAGLKYLSIFNYGSTRFPDWLGAPYLFHNMVSLSLKRCANCCSLPQIGQLPSLKYLGIEGMKAITEVGWEFYGNTSSSPIKPFQSLERLSFKEMEEWKEWHALGAGEFSCLLELSMVDCPKLTGELSIRFPSLRKLEISRCQQLMSNQVGLLLQDVPSLREMEISAIPELTELPPQLQHLFSLQELTVSQCPNLRELPTELQHLSSLQKLTISDIPNLTELPSHLQHLSSLQKLEISGMPNLKELPLELCRLINLELLTIEECPSLVSFPDVGLPPMLKALEIKGCAALQSLTVASTEGMDLMHINNICLEELRISECTSLLEVSFPIVVYLLLPWKHLRSPTVGV
ncbi:putative disease resistance RPP13-like protein 1 [Cornus florida]|uniref:putative disease resistance RPP13-like protein 1 n=1 Tax=Cornus florida TaxID=4283 RepID=UPI002898580C|nr:putative disease resistance RPP13-like protein 1 [Cornus florida]XP_059652808.1 putative disease resistance RPP13-like protein 1 [Cornus florida]